MNNLIRKGHDLTTKAQGYFAKNIENLLVQLVGQTSNYISTCIFRSYYIIIYVQYLISTVS